MQESDDLYLTCPECGRKAVMHLSKNNMMLCRLCGNKWPKDIKPTDIDNTKQYLQPVCPKCGGVWVNYKTKTNLLHCRKCGTYWSRVGDYIPTAKLNT